MLVLARKLYEKIIVTLPDGRLMEIVIVEIVHGYKVRLGFSAPDDVMVNREEVHDRIQGGK